MLWLWPWCWALWLVGLGLVEGERRTPIFEAPRPGRTHWGVAAQKDLYRDDYPPLSTLFSLGDGNGFPLGDLLDDTSVERVVSILRGNVKQWHFIESQLLEPNVNLHMPEIFIPLRHLTTTLEVLGNILFMKDELDEARECLERACPLMELLPVNINEDHKLASGCFALLREVYGKLQGEGVLALESDSSPRRRRRPGSS